VANGTESMRLQAYMEKLAALRAALGEAERPIEYVACTRVYLSLCLGVGLCD
jgi:hypothetical protein